MSPISPAVSSTITGCSQGERPTRWPASRPGFSISTSTVAADKAGREVALLPGQQRLQPLQPLGLFRFGTWSGISAPGVPGRGEYLNEKAWA